MDDIIDWGLDLNHNYRIDGVGTVNFSIRSDMKGRLKKLSKDQIADKIKASPQKILGKVRAAAPVRTGALREGMILSGKYENTSVPGKVVYDIYPDPAKNNIFVKESKAGKRYYYPASMEYGFRIPAYGGKRYPGKYFIKNAAVASETEHFQTVAKGIDEILTEL